MFSNSSGKRADVRQNALWGAGNRGGDSRGSALWGKGGRGAVVAALLALTLPLAASAGTGAAQAAPKPAFVEAKLLAKAQSSPNEKVRVIIQSDAGADAAEGAARGLGVLKHKLDVIGAVALELPAGRINALSKVPGLTVTTDEATKPLNTYTSNQLWPYEAGFNRLWGGASMPTIAIVDSGIDTSRADFDQRVVAQVDLVSTGKPNAAGDGRGHGTFVAGIAAGSAPGYAGGAPTAKLVSVDVLDDSGTGFTSDVIEGAEWVLANKDKYGIRVANFSLHSGGVSKFYDDPLNKAVNQLWFNGIVVVAAAGNYGVAGGASDVPHAPANNPFVITVGALDTAGTMLVGDDRQPSWSAYGRTPDGFWKPEVCAPGRYMIGPVSAGSTLAAQRPEQVRGNGYMELSGTSFAAPVVSALAAHVLARNPGYTPGQVKGAIMANTRAVPQGAPNACGVGQVNAFPTAVMVAPPDANAALNGFVTTSLLTGDKAFDAVSWSNVSWSNVSWSNVSWSNVSWSNVSWSNVSWSNVSWSNVSWSNVSWSNSASEDATDDVSPNGAGYPLPATLAP